MDITNLELDGFRILRNNPDIIYAKRIETDKLICFISESYANEIGPVEVLRVFTKQGFHPIIFGGDTSFTCALTGDKINRP